MSSEDDDGYVHDPAAFGDDGDDGDAPEDPPVEDAPGDPPVGDAPGNAASAPPAHGEGLGTRGRVLVVAVVLCFFVIPGVVLVRPPGLPFEVALLVFPLLPAVILGALAVWAMAGRS